MSQQQQALVLGAHESQVQTQQVTEKQYYSLQ